MYGVGAGLGNRIHDAAGGAAIFGGVARCDHLKLLNGGLGNGDDAPRTLAAADATEERLVVVRAIQHDVRVNAALTGKGDLSAGLRIYLRGGRQQREILKPAAVYRQVGQRGRVHRRR